MAEVREVQLEVIDQEAKGNPADQEAKGNPTEQTFGRNHIRAARSMSYKWWLVRIVIYTIFILGGQSAALILGRLYFEKGGTSKWLATLSQIGGFPLLLPIYFFLLPITNPSTSSDPTVNNITTTTSVDSSQSSFLKKLGLVYLPLGLLTALQGFLYSFGLQYLPVSTVTLISASQLAFTALFSYFLNHQKFTPFIVNSVVLLTISSVLLVVNDISKRPPGISKGHYIAGFVCTILGSAVFGLLLAGQQLAFRKVLKRKSVRVVVDVLFFEFLVATGPIMVGLFASGDAKGLKDEMDIYLLGKASYVLTLVWTGITWLVFSIGTLGVIFEVSSLYSNAIGTVGLPIVPVVAVFVFHDKFNGVKGMALVLAVWGFVSYLYQHYLDYQKSRIDSRIASDIYERYPPQQDI